MKKRGERQNVKRIESGREQKEKDRRKNEKVKAKREGKKRK